MGAATLDGDTAPWLTGEPVRAMLGSLSARGGRVAVTGGAVRDSILGKGDDVSDLDLTTTLDTVAASEALLDAGARTSAHPFLPGILFVSFGVHGDCLRHGSVRCVGDASPDALDRDAAARDFTVNALLCDPDGTVRDTVGGLDDLAARRLRWVSDGGAASDPVRMQRYFRMALRIGQREPDPAALEVVARDARLAAAVEPIRLAREMLILLDTHVPSEAVAALGGMRDAGLLDVLVPGHTLGRYEDYAARGVNGTMHLDGLAGMAILGAAGVPTMAFGDWRDDAVAIRASSFDREGGDPDGEDFGEAILAARRRRRQAAQRSAAGPL